MFYEYKINEYGRIGPGIACQTKTPQLSRFFLNFLPRISDYFALMISTKRWKEYMKKYYFHCGNNGPHQNESLFFCVNLHLKLKARNITGNCKSLLGNKIPTDFIV